MISGFLRRRRQWLFNTLRELEAKTANRAVACFMTGSKIPFRGRIARPRVRRRNGPHIAIGYRNGFLVDPSSWGRDEDQDVIGSTKDPSDIR